MKPLFAIPAVVLACLVASSTDASSLHFQSLAIDFANADDAKAKATWSEPDKLNVTKNGLGWDGAANSSRDGWIQTAPLALNSSCRPPYRASIRVSIHPKPAEFAMNDGRKLAPYAGDVYVRYSPDLRHWSTWQALEPCEPRSDAEKRNPGRHFSGTICVPHVGREQYTKRLREYAELDVPWKSDEDAAVRWILNKDPKFFTKELPFIGYVEFRYEAGFYAGQRINSFKAEMIYVIGGVHTPPKDKDADINRNLRPWSFRAEQMNQEAEPTREPVRK